MGFACGAGLHAAHDQLNRSAISLQAAGQILALRTIHTPAFYRQEDHPLGLQKERHSESHGPCRFRTAIPGDYDRLAD